VELWEVFKELLDKKEVKVSDVVKQTGIPYTTVDSIIKKKLKDIKFDNAVKIAEYFEVPIEYLATGQTNKIIEKNPCVCGRLNGIELLNEYGIKRLNLYLNEVLLADKDCFKERG